MTRSLTALALNCTLSPSPAESSTQLMIDQVFDAWKGHGLFASPVLQALNDSGFTVPAQGNVYWNGEAMSGVDHKDLDATPDPGETS